MSAAHTPGPWELARNDQHAGSIATLYGCEGGYIEVWTTKWPEGVNQEANARLIAAAPTMYDYIASSASNGCAEARKILEAIHGNP